MNKKALADTTKSTILASSQLKTKNEKNYSLLLADVDGTVVDVLAEQGSVGCWTNSNSIST